MKYLFRAVVEALQTLTLICSSSCLSVALKFLFAYLFIAALNLSCSSWDLCYPMPAQLSNGMWDLSPLTRDQTCVP